MGICVVSFSSRAGGNCSQIGKLICSLLKDSKSFDFAGFGIHPCGKCEYECFSDPAECPYSADMEHRLLDEITLSELTYFIKATRNTQNSFILETPHVRNKV